MQLDKEKLELEIAGNRFTTDAVVTAELDEIQQTAGHPYTLQTVISFLRKKLWVVEETEEGKYVLVFLTFHYI